MHWWKLLMWYLWGFHSDSSSLFFSQNPKLTLGDMIADDMEMFLAQNLLQTSRPAGVTNIIHLLNIFNNKNPPMIFCAIRRCGVTWDFTNFPTRNPNWYDRSIRCMFWPEMGLRWHSLVQPSPASQRGKSPLQWKTQQLEGARRSSSGSGSGFVLRS